MVPFNIDPDIAKARTLPSAWYRDESTYSQVVDRILAPSWQFFATEGEVSAALPGPTQDRPTTESAAFPGTILPGSVNEPVVLIRDAGGARVFSNVCTHRGNILVRQACSLREIKCMYHGRRFDTKGQFLNMPEFKEVADFPSERDHLSQLGHGSWGGLHFTRMNQHGTGSAPSFEKWTGVLNERLSFLPLEQGKHFSALDKDFEIRAHWALYVENYLEGFHIPFVHPGLNAMLEWNSYETSCNDVGVLQVGIAKRGDLAFDLPQNHVDYGKRVAAYYYWMFPNIMINVYPWGISLNIVLPHSIDRTVIRYRTLVWDESIHNQGAGSSLDTVEHEDDEVVEHQQKGMQSRLYNTGRYSVKREQGVHHFHRMLATYAL